MSTTNPKLVALAGVSAGSILGILGYKLYTHFTSHKKSKQVQELRTYLELLKAIDGCDFADLDVLVHKLEIFRAQGPSKMKIFTDFDLTLTSYYYNRKTKELGTTAYGVLEKSNLLPKEYHEGTEELYKKYHKIEIDPSVSDADKAKYMLEWWTTAHELLMKFGFKKSYLTEMVKESKVKLRDHCADFLDFFAQRQVPVVIVSGGITHIIQEILSQKYPRFDRNKMHVVSNEMLFNEDGNLIGFSDRIIHTMNKRAQLQKLEEDVSRDNLIVLGDHLQDSLVAARIHTNVQLRIGFMNRDDPKELQGFKDSFDLVLKNDVGFEHVLALLDFICGEPKQKGFDIKIQV
jgi:HAD superfamily hydrolase (TIGR01544 family)